MNPAWAVRFDRTFGRTFYRLHRWAYEASGGRVGASSPEGPMLLITTTGRRSGEPRTNPLLYVPDGDAFWVVGSNGGRPQPPAWYLNLTAEPRARVRAGRRVVQVRARVLTAEEAAEVWPSLTEHYRGWDHYRTLTDRELPVIHLEPEVEA